VKAFKSLPTAEQQSATVHMIETIRNRQRLDKIERRVKVAFVLAWVGIAHALIEGARAAVAWLGWRWGF
jgi:hypothetical protein